MLYPFSFINEFWGILFLSILTSIIALIVYKYVSSPSKIKKAKNKIKANILAIRLYKDFWKVIAGSFFKSLLYVLKYFALNFGVIIIILPLLLPMFVQMDVRYGMRPFQVGEDIVIKAAFSKNPNDLDIQLLENVNFKPLMNPVFIDAFKDDENKKPLQEVNWKVKVTGHGATKIKIKVNDQVFEKTLLTGKQKKAFSNKKFSASSIEHFIYPVEELFPENNTLKYIYIAYPRKSTPFLGILLPWYIYYLLFVFLIFLAFMKKFGVEI
jgi:hypothetical protein